MFTISHTTSQPSPVTLKADDYNLAKKEIQDSFTRHNHAYHIFRVVHPTTEDPDPLYGKNTYYLEPETFSNLKKGITSRGFTVEESDERIFSQFDHLLDCKKVTVSIPEKSEIESGYLSTGWQIDFKAHILREEALRALEKAVQKTVKSVNSDLPTLYTKEKIRLERLAKTPLPFPLLDSSQASDSIRFKFPIDESCPKGWETKAAQAVTKKLLKNGLTASVSHHQFIDIAPTIIVTMPKNP